VARAYGALSCHRASCKEMEPVAHGHDNDILAEYPGRQVEALSYTVIVLRNRMAIVSAPSGPE